MRLGKHVVRVVKHAAVRLCALPFHHAACDAVLSVEYLSTPFNMIACCTAGTCVILAFTLSIFMMILLYVMVFAGSVGARTGGCTI